MRRCSARLGLVGWVLAVAVAALALSRAGSGPLAAPALGEPATWADWLAAREPIEAAVALLRLAALAGLWYLLLASLVGATLRILCAERLVAVADRLTVPTVRRLLVATASVSLASGLAPSLLLGRGALPAVVAAAAEAPPTTTSTAVTVPGDRTAPTLTMRMLPSDGESTSTVSAAPPQAAATEAQAETGEPVQTWTVRPGECFWSIAEDVLTQVWGRSPTDAEIIPYWRVLIEANRTSLADRENEDLIFPAQRFTVPPPPPVR
jgi:hypothetical protein